MINNNIEICKHIQNNIDKLCQTEIDEIFKIIHNNSSKYTQNNNGVFINLNWMDHHILMKIYDYINFCLKSQNEISKYEIMKSLLNDNINKDKNCKDKKEEDEYEELKNIAKISLINLKQTRISSSMKFYLLKKKFIKKNLSSIISFDNLLTHEEYVL
jgi:hypothetical protein